MENKIQSMQKKLLVNYIFQRMAIKLKHED